MENQNSNQIIIPYFRQRYIILASFLITLSILFLLNNFNLFQDLNFLFILNFWPLPLLMFGIYIAFRGKKIASYITGVNGIMIAITVFAVIGVMPFKIPFLPELNTNKTSSINPNIKFDTNISTPVPKPKTEKANLIFRSTNGVFYFRGSIDEGLTEYTSKSTFGEYRYEQSKKDNIETVDIRFDSERVPWKITSEANSFDIKLNKETKWNLDTEIENSEMNLELGYYKVEKLRVKASNSTVKIYLDKYSFTGDLKLELDANLSSINIRVPKGYGVQLINTSRTTVKDIEEMEDKGNGVFESKEFEKSSGKLYIDSSTILSNIVIDRF